MWDFWHLSEGTERRQKCFLIRCFGRCLSLMSIIEESSVADMIVILRLRRAKVQDGKQHELNS